MPIGDLAKKAGGFVGSRVKENFKQSPVGKGVAAYKSWKGARDKAKAAPDFKPQGQMSGVGLQAPQQAFGAALRPQAPQIQAPQLGSPGAPPFTPGGGAGIAAGGLGPQASQALGRGGFAQPAGGGFGPPQIQGKLGAPVPNTAFQRQPLGGTGQGLF